MKFLNSLQVSISDGTALLDIDIRLCGCSLENLRMSNDWLNSLLQQLPAVKLQFH